jgi:hypothetical protein
LKHRLGLIQLACLFLFLNGSSFGGAYIPARIARYAATATGS